MLVLLLLDLFIPQIFVLFTKKFLKDKNTFYTFVFPSMSDSISVQMICAVLSRSVVSDSLWPHGL